MRVIHGWVRLGSDCVILGLDSYQFHLYHVMRALAVPKSAQDDLPGLCDVSNGQLALVTRCSRSTIIRVKKELLTMGLLAYQRKQYYVLDPPIETLHNHKVVLNQIGAFLETNGGTHAPLNGAPRRNGFRHISQVCPDTAPVPPGHTTCSPRTHYLFPPDTLPVPPRHTFPICPDSTQEKKRRREEVSLRGAEHPMRAETTTEFGVLPTPEARREHVGAAASKPKALYSALVTLFPGGGFPAPGGGARCPAIGRLGAMEKAHGWGQVLEQMEHARIDQAVGKVAQGDILSWIERRLQGGVRGRTYRGRSGKTMSATDIGIPVEFEQSDWKTAVRVGELG